MAIRPPKPTPSTNALVDDLLVGGAAPIAATSAYLGIRMTIAECLTVFRKEVQRVRSGDVGNLEATLTAQALSLNAIFADLVYHVSSYDPCRSQ